MLNMDVAALAGSASNTTGSSSGANGLGGINGQDFMNILLKQLQFQDPFEPMSNQEMAAQIATIRELEVNTRLGSALEQITDQQRFGAAAALIGKYARGTATDSEGTEFPAEGVVTGVRFTRNGEVVLELDTGSSLPLSGVEQITDVDSIF
jgi:flagellar basal-body rod modification protein FlgD